MAVFNLRWVNRSHSTQDWIISNGDAFTLAPDFQRAVNININNTYTFGIAVSTNGGYAHADLTYTIGTNAWTLASVTPNEWRLTQGGGVVTVACLLEDVVQANPPLYAAEVPVYAADELLGAVSYPAYQLYKDYDRTTYCSARKVHNHDEGRAWIGLCLEAHPDSAVFRTWLSDNQSGIIWPD